MGRRRGSVLIIVLLIVFLVTAGIAVIQKLSVENVHRTQSLYLLEDSMLRADGLIAMLTSRFKRDLTITANQPLPIAESVTESGEWDGRAFDMGWEAAKHSDTATAWDVTVWIRFEDDRPSRTYRYALELKLPTQLAPRPVAVRGLAFDDVDPTSQTARKAAVAKLTRADALAAQGRLESWSDRFDGVGSENPAGLARRIASGPDANVLALLPDIVARLAAIRDTGLVSDRVAQARSVLALAQPLARRWVDVARYTLAGALMRHADESVPLVRAALRKEALQILETALTPTGACCGEAKVLWRWAFLKMQMLADPSDAGPLVTTRRQVGREIAARCGREGFFHHDADITVPELPGLFEQSWSARVATSVKISDTSYLLVTMRDDGANPIIVMESSKPLNPMDWSPDGGTLLTLTTVDGPPDKWRDNDAKAGNGWRLSLEGLDMVDVETPFEGYPTMGGDRRDIWTTAEFSPDGRLVIYNGVFPDEPQDSYENGSVHCWMAQGQRRMALWTNVTAGPFMAIGTLSPKGDRMATFANRRRMDRPPSLYVMDLERALDRKYQFTSGPLDDTQLGPEKPELLAHAPFDDIPPGCAISGFNWKHVGGGDYLAYTYTEPTASTVVFYRTDQEKRPEPLMSPKLPGDPTVRASYQNHSTIGTLVRNPPGYLVGIKDSLYLVPLPDSPDATTAVPTPWPIGMAGDLDTIDTVHAPPWGEVAFFTARLKGGPHALYSMDLRTGQAKLIAGPGGKLARAQEVGRLAVSPIPVTNNPPDFAP